MGARHPHNFQSNKSICFGYVLDSLAGVEVDLENATESSLSIGAVSVTTEFSFASSSSSSSSMYSFRNIMCNIVIMVMRETHLKAIPNVSKQKKENRKNV